MSIKRWSSCQAKGKNEVILSFILNRSKYLAYIRLWFDRWGLARDQLDQLGISDDKSHCLTQDEMYDKRTMKIWLIHVLYTKNSLNFIWVWWIFRLTKNTMRSIISFYTSYRSTVRWNTSSKWQLDRCGELFFAANQRWSDGCTWICTHLLGYRWWKIAIVHRNSETWRRWKQFSTAYLQISSKSAETLIVFY